MTAVHELLQCVRARGAEVRLGGPTGIEVVRYDRLDRGTIARLRQSKPDLRRALEAENEAIAIASARRLLRECGFPPDTARCAFHQGHPSRPCRQCGASWREHCRAMESAGPAHCSGINA